MMRWWLSFSDGKLPGGSQFLGACIVHGADFPLAITEAHRLGINPGGEVKGVGIPSEMKIDGQFVGRLMDRDECERFDAQKGRCS